MEEPTSISNLERVWAYNQDLETKIGVHLERKLPLPVVNHDWANQFYIL